MAEKSLVAILNMVCTDVADAVEQSRLIVACRHGGRVGKWKLYRVVGYGGETVRRWLSGCVDSEGVTVTWLQHLQYFTTEQKECEMVDSYESCLLHVEFEDFQVYSKRAKSRLDFCTLALFGQGKSRRDSK